MTEIEFQSFQKIARLSREIIVSEKINGTNAQVMITEDGRILAGSRTRWISASSDNHGFAAWVDHNKDELIKLGPGRHYGEWWGSGIGLGYGLKSGENRFSLFNSSRWEDDSIRPKCCEVVPVLYVGPFSTSAIDGVIDNLRAHGSVAAPGYMKPEGVVIYHPQGNVLFKKTLDDDSTGKTHGHDDSRVLQWSLAGDTASSGC
jgi:hypothetical protein